MFSNIVVEKIIFKNSDQEVLIVAKDKIEKIYTSYYFGNDKLNDSQCSVICIEIKYATLAGVIKDRTIADYFNVKLDKIMTQPMKLIIEGLHKKLGSLGIDFNNLIVYEVNRNKNILVVKLISDDFIEKKKVNEENKRLIL